MLMKKPSYRWFFSFLKPYCGSIFFATASGVLRYLIPLFVPWSIKVIIDDILRPPFTPSSFSRLNGLAVTLIGLFVLWTFLSFIRFYLSGLAGNKIIFDLRHRLYVHLQKMSLSFFEKQHVGAVVSRMMSDITSVQNVVGYGITALLMDTSCVLIIAVILMKVHFMLALLSLALIPAYVFVGRIFSEKIRSSSYCIQQQIEKLSGYLHEKFLGISIIQSFVRENDEEEAFLERAKNHLDATQKNMTQQSLGLSLTGFLASVAPLLVIWYGGICVMRSTLTIGELAAFYAYVGLLYAPITRLSELHIVIGNSLAAIDRIFEIFEIPSEVQEKKKAPSLKATTGEIQFQNVCFSYTAEIPVLCDFNLNISPGEHVVLAGSNGSGKSTLIKLLLRFYDPQKGSILIDHQNICDVTLASLRKQIAFVPQEPLLFSGSIFDNLLYGKPEASENEVMAACEAVHVHEFIMNLPERYQTQVGERGIMLSAGEKQRIAIARAYLKNASVLVLDEPASALDESSALLVREGLRTLSRGRTTLMIDHHPSLISDTDRILWVSKSVLLGPNKISDLIRLGNS